MQTSSYGFSCKLINTNKYFINQISNLSEIILNFFQTPLGFVCWWCKIHSKNVEHNGCLQKPVDKKVHGGEIQQKQERTH